MARRTLTAFSLAAAIFTHATPSGAQTNACALAQTDHRKDLVHVPFQVIDGRIYVEVKVNGQGPYIFALDTGASGVGRADSNLVAALGLPKVDVGKTSDRVSEREVEIVRMGSVQFGGLKRTNAEVITRDYRSRAAPNAAFAGILGRGFFEDGLLVIDYGRSTVSFTRSQSLTPDMAGALRYEKAFRVPISIAGVETLGNLDTGANVAFVLPRTFYDQLSSAPLGDAATGTLTNGKIETYRVTLKGPFRVGQAAANNVEVRVSERFPEVLVGAHFLQNSIVLIDQRSQTVAVCPVPQRKAH